MNDDIKVLYREIQERFVKVIWTHKIQLCQAGIYRKANNRNKKIMMILSVLVSASAITDIFKWLPECVILPVFAIFSLVLTYFTTKVQSENLDKMASDNERFAAIMHSLRNRYAGLLSDILAGGLTKEQIIAQRKQLEKDEDLAYSGVVPYTSSKAVEDAETALKFKQESTTTDEEIKMIVSKNLQITK